MNIFAASALIGLVEHAKERKGSVGWYPSSSFDLSPLLFPMPECWQATKVWILNDDYLHPTWNRNEAPYPHSGQDPFDAWGLRAEVIHNRDESQSWCFVRRLNVTVAGSEHTVLLLKVSDEDLLTFFHKRHASVRPDLAVAHRVGGTSMLVGDQHLRTKFGAHLLQLGIRKAISTDDEFCGTSGLDGFERLTNQFSGFIGAIHRKQASSYQAQ